MILGVAEKIEMSLIAVGIIDNIGEVFKEIKKNIHEIIIDYCPGL